MHPVHAGKAFTSTSTATPGARGPSSSPSRAQSGATARSTALCSEHHPGGQHAWGAEALPGRIFELRYEELVTTPREVVGRMLAFLGLPWQEACLSPGANASTVRTFSRLQVRSAIHAGSVGRWKTYSAWLGPILEAEA